MSPLVDNRITEKQLELLKSFRYLTDDIQISEVKELLHLYYQHKLDVAINEEEEKHNYSAEVYEAWLKAKESGAE